MSKSVARITVVYWKSSECISVAGEKKKKKKGNYKRKLCIVENAEKVLSSQSETTDFFSFSVLIHQHTQHKNCSFQV